jgi:hypothetical protein
MLLAADVGGFHKAYEFSNYGLAGAPNMLVSPHATAPFYAAVVWLSS